MVEKNKKLFKSKKLLKEVKKTREKVEFLLEGKLDQKMREKIKKILEKNGFLIFGYKYLGVYYDLIKELRSFRYSIESKIDKDESLIKEGYLRILVCPFCGYPGRKMFFDVRRSRIDCLCENCGKLFSWLDSKVLEFRGVSLGTRD